MKAGNKVRYVKAGPVGWESLDWAEKAGCVLGSIYTISETDMDCSAPSVYIEEDCSAIGYYIHPDHFEVVTDD